MASIVTVTLEDSVIKGMAGSAVHRQAFPFLASLQQAARKPGCSRCGSNADKNALTKELQKVRTAFATLSAEGRRKLKALLKADKIRVRYQQGGSTVLVTF